MQSPSVILFERVMTHLKIDFAIGRNHLIKTYKEYSQGMLTFSYTSARSGRQVMIPIDFSKGVSDLYTVLNNRL